jgi:methylmalonyl-CoA mutase N-terminal domain/subunit
VERDQVEELRKYKENRDGGAVRRSLDAIRTAAKDGSNLMPPLLEGVKRGVTLGEVVETLKTEFGEWREPPIYW